MGEALLTPIAHSNWDLSRAQHLLNRAGFAIPASLARRLASLEPIAAVAYVVDSAPDTAQDPDFLVSPAPYRELRAQRDALSADELRQMSRDIRQEERLAVEQLKAWWLERMYTTSRPLDEKLALFWHGHFATSAQKVPSSRLSFELNDVFRRNARGNLKELTIAVGQSPVMLRYLDNNRNVKGKPNENWARELMELFTMGVGNYSEEDIKESARAFTGWTSEGWGFVYRESAHDFGEKRFMGRTGNFDGWDVIDIIFEQPATARHFARELWSYFAYENPEEEIVDGLAATLRAHDYELKPFLREMFLSEAFYSEKCRGSRIKSPVELVIQLAGDLGLENPPYGAMARACAQLGQNLFYPPNVKGWDGGRAWINANTLMLRYNLPKQLALATGDKSRGMDSGMMMSMADARSFRDSAVREILNEHMMNLPPTERRALRTRIRRADSGRERRRVVSEALQSRPLQEVWDIRPVFAALEFETAGECLQALQKRFLSVPLSSEQEATLLETLGADQADDRLTADALEPSRMEAVLHLILSTAEYQLC